MHTAYRHKAILQIRKWLEVYQRTTDRHQNPFTPTKFLWLVFCNFVSFVLRQQHYCLGLSTTIMSEQTTKKKDSKRRRKSDESSKAKKDEKKVEKKIEEEPESEDEDLLAAAAQWAKGGGGSGSTDQVEDKYKTYSLHLTQLSFETKEYELRTFFEKNGCILTSVRKVYDGSGQQKTFRGVAFVDVSDKVSYDKALSLNRRVLLGRKINVRPTKTKEELGDIVARTKELVEEKIRKEREKQDNENNGEATKDDKKKDDRKKPSKPRSRDDRDTGEKKTKRRKKSDSEGEKSEEPKLTKKERNRRAAIIMRRRR